MFIFFTVNCAVEHFKWCNSRCDFVKQQIPEISKNQCCCCVFGDGLTGTLLYDTSDTLWAFYKPEQYFYHTFVGEIQTELHTNKK